jgi:subtilisin family serine protease
MIATLLIPLGLGLWLLSSFAGIQAGIAASEPMDTYIIWLHEPALASHAQRAAGTAKLDLSRLENQSYLDHLDSRHKTLIEDLVIQLGRPVTVRYQYFYALNGMAVRLRPSEAQRVEAMTDVAGVERQVKYAISTDAGPAWIGAPQIWSGGAGLATQGEGIIIGVIDTGINSDHPSFADVGGDGYDHTNPWGPGTYVGVCDSGDAQYQPGFPCSDKLIGAWTYLTETVTPEDSNGHGSHTASTAAGNVVTATLSGSNVAFTNTISGVAPHANIIAYDVCSHVCPTASLLAAIDQAIADGVDVINYSLSGADDPWQDSIQLAFLDAYNAGIVVVAAAENQGPSLGTVVHTAPWVISVGATTHNRVLAQDLMNMAGGATTPPGTIRGAGFAAGHGPAPIVHGADFGDALCQSNFAPGTWTNGEIVVCDSGINSAKSKTNKVIAGGAAGIVVANVSPGDEELVPSGFSIPGMHIGTTDGDVLRAWLASGSVHTATISGFIADYSDSNGDLMAGFSSRGPSDFSIMAPNLTAPGVAVWGAIANDSLPVGWEYWRFNGTSMSSPHVAGSAALLKALHPGWSPAQIKSALMTTAYNGPSLLDEDKSTPADPLDYGAGRVQVFNAAQAGLILNESGANFLDADPAGSGDPRQLNIASMTDLVCQNSCAFTRTVQNSLAVTATWTVSASAPAGMQITYSPAGFSLSPGETQKISVDIDVLGLPEAAWAFANLWLVNTAQSGPGPLAPDAHMAISLLPEHLIEPTIVISPPSLQITQTRDQVVTQTLLLENAGIGPLDWSVFEAAGTLRLANSGGVCDSPSDLPWVSASPTAGTTAEAGSDEIILSFDSTGLTPGWYAGTLCISSNDLLNPMTELALNLRIIHSIFMPVIQGPP